MYRSVLVTIILPVFLCFVSGTNSVCAQDCDEGWLINGRKELETLIRSESAHETIILADSLWRKIGGTHWEGCDESLWIMYARARALELEKRFQAAIQIYFNLIDHGNKTSKFELVASCHISVARCMEIMVRKDETIRYLDIALKLIQEHNLKILLPYYYVRKSSYFRIFESKDSSMIYAKKALYWSDFYQDTIQQADCYLLLGILFGSTDSSFYYFNEARITFLKLKNYNNAASMVINYIINFSNKGADKMANIWLDTLNNYLSLCDKNSKEYHYNKSFYCIGKAKYFDGIGKVDSARSYGRIGYDHLVMYLNSPDVSGVSQTEIDFFLSKEKERSSIIEKQSKVQQIGLIFTGLTILFILGGLFSNVAKRKKIEEQKELIISKNLELNVSLKKQNLLLSEIHHRVKNNLQLVISLLTLHYNRVKGNNEYKYLEDVSNKVRSIALIHEHLYNKGEFEKIYLVDYLKELLELFRKLESSGNAFDYSVEGPEKIILNLDTVMPIGIICSELINNSLKYAKTSSGSLYIAVEIRCEDDDFILHYQDNGENDECPDQENLKSGMGTILIQSMVRQLQAKASSISLGTSHFQLIFKEKVISKL